MPPKNYMVNSPTLGSVAEMCFTKPNQRGNYIHQCTVVRRWRKPTVDIPIGKRRVRRIRVTDPGRQKTDQSNASQPIGGTNLCISLPGRHIPGPRIPGFAGL